MSSSKLQGHPSLPAPVVHAGFSVPQSKSHVLAGVQDAYWSDDEADEVECPLCLEEMDISDLNFKPCVCGYQICRFCWHHIKENLNKRCPACRRAYTDDAVEFKVVNPEDHKKLTQQKKQRDRERKELEALGRRHLANVRVVQRNVVYVVGIGPRFAKEELISTLRSHEYFGQYGKISKILLTKRTPTSGGTPVVGLYITYHRREDAARAIAAVDGTASPGGGKDIMRASYGTTKYCMTFLRGVACTDNNCMNLHEWGDEKDCFTKEDLTTLKHTMKATESRSTRSGKEGDGLPRSAAWASKNANFPLPSANTSSRSANRRGGRVHSGRPANSQAPETRSSPAKVAKVNAVPSGATKPPSHASSSRPSTPSSQRPTSPTETKGKHRKAASVKKESLPPQSPVPTPSAEFTHDSIRRKSESPSPHVIDGPPPGLPAIPPGLTPPGLAVPPGLSMPPRVDSASPQTPILQSNYQMSNAARRLLDDLTARRHQTDLAHASPFPDLDHTLHVLSGEHGTFGGFGFNLDPELAVAEEELPPIPTVDAEAEAEAEVPFKGTFLDAFPALRTPGMPNPFTAPSPGLYPHNPSRAIYDPLAVRVTPPLLEKQMTGSSSGYVGSFNPFGDSNDSSAGSVPSAPLDEDRRVSRFGFARGRQAPNLAASPSHVTSPLAVPPSETSSFYSSSTNGNAAIAPQQSHQWNSQQDYPAYTHQLPPAQSPLAHQAGPVPLQPHPSSVNSQARFQPTYERTTAVVSEAQLRDFIQASRSQQHVNEPPPPAMYKQGTYPQFSDPAIMSAGYVQNSQATLPSAAYQQHHTDANQMAFGHPPGLAAGFPQLSYGNGADAQHAGATIDVPPNVSQSASITSIPPQKQDYSRPVLSPSDFPALSSATAPPPPSSGTPPSFSPGSLEGTNPMILTQKGKAQEKAEKKAMKKAERQRIALEKEKEKEKEREREKTQEKEAQAAREKAAKERAAREKAEKEKEKTAKDKADREERAAKEKTAANAVSQTVKQLQAEQMVKGKAPTTPEISSNNKDVETVAPGPLLSKKPKKNKPLARTIKIPHQGPTTNPPDEGFSMTAPHPLPSNAPGTATSSSVNSRSQSVERDTSTSLQELFEELHLLNPEMDLPTHPLFDLNKMKPETSVPVEYGPLVHALSALSVSGSGSYGNAIPTGSMDNAVSNFQQLLETLTNTISDLLHLLPRATWDDNSSFNGSLQDMMKGGESLDVAGEKEGNRGDDVATLTLALERRARWMEIQLSKLEELHRDINTAAVRAVLSFNDHGWDRHRFLPHGTNALTRFHAIGIKVDEELGIIIPMDSAELEKKLEIANEASTFAEADLRESMEKMHRMKPLPDY